MAQGYTGLRDGAGRLDLRGAEFDRIVAHAHALRLRVMWRVIRRFARSVFRLIEKKPRTGVQIIGART